MCDLIAFFWLVGRLARTNFCACDFLPPKLIYFVGFSGENRLNQSIDSVAENACINKFERKKNRTKKTVDFLQCNYMLNHAISNAITAKNPANLSKMTEEPHTQRQRCLQNATFFFDFSHGYLSHIFGSATCIQNHKPIQTSPEKTKLNQSKTKKCWRF